MIFQTLLKAHGLLPGGRTVIAGTGPLLWLLAAQILRAGGRIEALLDTTPRANWLRAAAHLPDFLLSPYATKGFALLREVGARVPVFKVNRVEAVGDGKLREVVFDGGRLAADLLLLHQGVVPNTNMAMAAGVAHAWNERQLCFQPVLDEDFGSSVPGIAVAGGGSERLEGSQNARSVDMTGRDRMLDGDRIIAATQIAHRRETLLQHGAGERGAFKSAIDI